MQATRTTHVQATQTTHVQATVRPPGSTCLRSRGQKPRVDIFWSGEVPGMSFLWIGVRPGVLLPCIVRLVCGVGWKRLEEIPKWCRRPVAPPPQWESVGYNLNFSFIMPVNVFQVEITKSGVACHPGSCVPTNSSCSSFQRDPSPP